jgi:hypothetical protein
MTMCPGQDDRSNRAVGYHREGQAESSDRRIKRQRGQAPRSPFRIGQPELGMCRWRTRTNEAQDECCGPEKIAEAAQRRWIDQSGQGSLAVRQGRKKDSEVGTSRDAIQNSPSRTAPSPKGHILKDSRARERGSTRFHFKLLKESGRSVVNLTAVSPRNDLTNSQLRRVRCDCWPTASGSPARLQPKYRHLDRTSRHRL